MALTKVLTGGIADDAIGNTKLALDADYAFTGTISGAGVSTATSTLPSEGGAATTIVAQGLAKSWCHIDGDGTASILDSFNGTSMTDHGTGDYTFTIANDFLSAARRNCAMGCWNSDNRSQGITNATRGMQIYQDAAAEAAGTFRVNVIYGASSNANGAVYDSGSVYLTFHGDLA